MRKRSSFKLQWERSPRTRWDEDINAFNLEEFVGFA